MVANWRRPAEEPCQFDALAACGRTKLTVDSDSTDGSHVRVVGGQGRGEELHPVAARARCRVSPDPATVISAWSPTAGPALSHPSPAPRACSCAALAVRGRPRGRAVEGARRRGLGAAQGVLVRQYSCSGTYVVWKGLRVRCRRESRRRTFSERASAPKAAPAPLSRRSDGLRGLARCRTAFLQSYRAARCSAAVLVAILGVLTTSSPRR